MVCEGPDPPEDANGFTAPPAHVLHNAGDESDEDIIATYEGYELLPQGPESFNQNASSDEEPEERLEDNTATPATDLPPIEPMERVLTREVWQSPRQTDPIAMDSDHAQQVMSAMANIVLPSTAIPEWARTLSEDQWKEQLKQRIDTLKTKT